MKTFRTKTYERGLKRIAKLGGSKADFAAMEAGIIRDLSAGDVIQDSGGLRKVRFGFGNLGKRGGGRTIYYHWVDDGAVYFLAAYAKVDQEDLTAEERKLFARLIEEAKRA